MRFRTVLAVLLAMLAAVALGCFAACRVLMPAALPPPVPDPVCVAHAATVGSSAAPGATAAPSGEAGTADASLAPDQMANAATIAAVGVRRGLPVRAVQVALATAMQESKLTNLPGGDRDSIGLFQQRPSQGWGTEQQLADPRFAAGAFYTALLKVRGWQTMDLSAAAQAVQHSALPEAYVQWSDQADILAHALTDAVGAPVTCRYIKDSEPSGPAALDALAVEFGADWGSTGAVKSTDGTGITVPATDPHAAWRYGSWLVAHAERCGIERVQVGGSTWTAGSGRWTTANGATGQTVVAKVYRPKGG